ncbi:hypothetical protein JL193_03080 [Polaribacter batillariae]|uniref:Adhesin domain-containing protein n=1 Tax=Polaribacter batillariae TaxID=2808900 RepID=A0ABX7SX69_9FLAO|nr:hypothetical protein [Polaribacter batillariae]QTD38299.1 hypothetical protein JL193_03080 [Polaribacter batillariae]
MRFGTIRKNLAIDTEYGSLTIKNLVKDFEKVDISGQYTGIKIYVAPAIAFHFEIDLQYASFKRNNDKIEFFKTNSKPTKKYYEGKYGNGKTSGELKVNSQYGSVRIEEN